VRTQHSLELLLHETLQLHGADRYKTRVLAVPAQAPHRRRRVGLAASDAVLRTGAADAEGSDSSDDDDDDDGEIATPPGVPATAAAALARHRRRTESAQPRLARCVCVPCDRDCAVITCRRLTLRHAQCARQARAAVAAARR
jgi:hypothetical protein